MPERPNAGCERRCDDGLSFRKAALGDQGVGVIMEKL
jgi:hypothetical protein